MTDCGGIVVSNACKRIDGVTVLRDVSCHARAGRVTALLGPNGAGKSTLLRALTGLVRLDSGSVTIHGYRHGAHDRPTAIGVLIDPHALHPGRTAYGQLKVINAATGRGPSRIAHILEVVGLGGHGRVRVSEMSLGMRQRLALAVALIDDPHTLILDEPHNGLDAEAISWLREVVRRFAQAGRTVLMSSHLLAEIQVIADDVIVIDDGAVRAQAPMVELLGPDPAIGDLERWYFDVTGAGR
ncbi:MAG: ATP-binding cassette domain-containing protein [Gordonia sp. (in: high G+C Gram-positive bacteria)]